MKKKVIGILVCTLLIAAAVLPVAGTINNNENIKTVNNNENIIEDQTSDEPEPQCSAVSSDDEWPMFLHDLENTGYSTSTAPGTNMIIKWIYHIEDGAGIESSPAVVNGKVYIGSDDKYLYCLDANTGEVLWKHYVESGTSVCSPAVYDGKVYIGAVYDYIHCLDADTGESIWEFYKGNAISTSPTVVNGKVYIGILRRGDIDGRLYCLDADTGNKLWDYDMGYFEISSPAVYDDKVYICSQDTNLYCFDADTGDKLWEYDTGGLKAAYSHPAISDGRVYCGSSRLNCVDAETGEEIWHFDEQCYTSPAVAYGKVYFPAYVTGGFYCLDKYTGELIWNNPEDGNTRYSSPAVADGKVYVVVWKTGDLICLNAETGEKLWDYQTNPSEYVFNSPAVAYGRVYVAGGLTDNVYCFDDSLPPDPPAIDGPTVGTPNRSYSYTIQATDPEGGDIYYYVDWGDDTNSSWLGPYSSGEEITLRHAWTEVDTYILRAQAKNTYDVKSPWSELDVGISNAPDAPSITGETNGNVGVEYEYTFNSVDPDGDDVKYRISWGDGEFDTTDFSPSGTDVKVKHTWSKKGTFKIIARAEDIYGVESDWGELEVTMPRSKVISNNQLLLKMLQQFPNAFPLLQHLLGLQ